MDRIRLLDLPAGGEPTGLTGTPVASGRIDLVWTAATENVGVAGYNVYRDGTRINWRTAAAGEATPWANVGVGVL